MWEKKKKYQFRSGFVTALEVRSAPGYEDGGDVVVADKATLRQGCRRHWRRLCRPELHHHHQSEE